jgi:hypothetical protein
VRVRDPSSSGSKYPVNSALWSPPIRTGRKNSSKNVLASGAVSAMAQRPCQSGSSEVHAGVAEDGQRGGVIVVFPPGQVGEIDELRGSFSHTGGG